MTETNFPALLDHWATTLSYILLIAYVFSLGARWHWLPDLFSHFMIQYAIGGFFLFLTLLFLQKYSLSSACLIVCLASLYHIVQVMPLAPQTANDPSFTVAQYNRLHTNKNYSAMISWLREDADKLDVVSIQEITQEAIDELQAVKNIYPYSFPERKMRGTDVYLLSKYPILESEVIARKWDVPTSFGLKIKVAIKDTPLTLYAIHTQTPLTKDTEHQRELELTQMAKVIALDKSPNIIFLGDWNITPFSPNFKTVLNVSRLKNQYSSYLAHVSSWPSFLYLPFLKIPIDQVLFSDRLDLVEKKISPAMGSDHHPLIASFAVRKE